MPLFDLTGKKAFVTGASRGIGRVIAVALAEAGADVALVARSADGLAETADQVTAQGRKAFVIPADVTHQEEVSAAVAAAIEQLGHVDVVVNNAGGSNFLVPFLDLRLPGWDKLIRLNLDSAMYVCHAIGGHLVQRGQGSVINVASVAGVAASPFLSPYGAAKAGLVSLTKSLAVEWATLGVRVNALCPGWTATDLNRNLWEDEAAGKATVAGVPMRRWGQPEEMAGPAVFLASDASSYMTGQALNSVPFHLYLNAVRPQSTFSAEAHQGGTDVSYAKGTEGAIDIKSISAEGYGDLARNMKFTAPDDGNQDDHTVMEITLPKPLAPGEVIRFQLAFHDKFPLSVARNGYKRDFIMGAQWFPKIGVLWHGAWNCHQYHFNTEFFADFGTYNVILRVPEQYTVGASGIETGYQENHDGTKTLSYRGEDIHDFAWAASPHFQVADDTFVNDLGTVKLHALILSSHASQRDRYLPS